MKACIILTIAILAIKVQAASWTYGTGQSSWEDTYPLCTSGQLQSPIDV